MISELSHNNITEAEYYAQIASLKEPTLQAYQRLVSEIDAALLQHDPDSLLALISYMETGEGQLALKFLGDANRIHKMLSTISIEVEFNKSPFSTNCSSCKNLLEKYELTVFALRRLHFQLSDTSMLEAIDYLQHTAASPIAICLLATENHLFPDSLLIDTLCEVYHDIWSDSDFQFFASYLKTHAYI